MIKVSIIVPAYNEENTILSVLEKIAAQSVEGVEFEVVVVDDGSFDRTQELVQSRPELYSQFIRQTINGGKGAAVRAGLKAATGDYILFQDADLEYDPADYAKLMLPACRFNADLIVGSRFLAPQYSRVFYFWHRLGNTFITQLFNILNNTTFTDIYTCYVMFRRSLVQPDALKTDGWDQQAEILSTVVRKGNVYYEVPISYHGRTYAEGKKIKAYHIVSVIVAIIKGRFQ